MHLKFTNFLSSNAFIIHLSLPKLFLIKSAFTLNLCNFTSLAHYIYQPQPNISNDVTKGFLLHMLLSWTQKYLIVALSLHEPKLCSLLLDQCFYQKIATRELKGKYFVLYRLYNQVLQLSYYYSIVLYAFYMADCQLNRWWIIYTL